MRRVSNSLKSYKTVYELKKVGTEEAISYCLRRSYENCKSSKSIACQISACYGIAKEIVIILDYKMTPGIGS